MKAKSIFLVLLMTLTLFSITAIYAEEATVGDSTFTVPDGFSINETTDNTVTLTGNDNTAIAIYSGDTKSIEDARQSRLDAGFTLSGEETYDVNGIAVNQQNCNKDGINSCVYTFNKNGKDYIISYNLVEGQDIPSNEDNPVTEIVNSLN